MFRHIIRGLFSKIINRYPRRLIFSKKQEHLIRIRNHYIPPAVILGIGCVYAKSENDDLVSNFGEEIKRATLQGEKYLAQLMRVLRTLILQTSVEYQENLIEQIELTRESTKIGPIGEHWDKLTVYRVKGNELKEELNKYESLAISLSEIVEAEVKTSLAMGNRFILEQLHSELEKLQKLYKEQLQEIHKYEEILLEANRDSILHGIRLK